MKFYAHRKKTFFKCDYRSTTFVNAAILTPCILIFIVFCFLLVLFVHLFVFLTYCYVLSSNVNRSVSFVATFSQWTVQLATAHLVAKNKMINN